MSRADNFITRWREALPERLFDLPVFLLWQRRPKSGKPGKFDKVPYYANGRRRSGANGGTEDRVQLVDLSDALAAYQRGRYDGIGVALLPDVTFWALDLDNCISEGKLSPLARRVVNTGTYTERSPSSSGVRALFASKAGADAKNHGAGVETFDSRGFVTLTGDRLGGSSLLRCSPDLLAEILAIVRASQRTQSGAGVHAQLPPENPQLSRSVRLSIPMWRRLADPYPSGCDRSAVAFSIAIQLARQGLTREQAIEVMSAPEIAAPALDRRRGDIASAREWMWRYCVLPAFQSSGGADGG